MNATMLPVVKMHGAHNVFVLLDERPARYEGYAKLARALCAPQGELGGADGLLVLRDGDASSIEMHIYNADGREAEMCGNGVRCVARYLAERGGGESFLIGTLAGPVRATVVSRMPFLVRVDMGFVTFAHEGRTQRLEVDGLVWTYDDVSVGNPHAVLFVPDVDAVALEALGAQFNRHPRFPDGTNVHVVQRLDVATLRVRHYERGVGLTQACGTGAVACAALVIAREGTRTPVTVRVPGGTLEVTWFAGEHAFLTGPAETMFARTVPA